MAKTLQEWLETDVAAVADRPVSWLSEYHFFRDPPRPTYSDLGLFFAPADGVILYIEEVKPEDSIVDIKGSPYSLRDALDDPAFDEPCLVVGIFMTFHDVHVNRVPYPGRLSYQLLDPIDTYNHPMLELEEDLLQRLHVAPERATYLHHNQRMVNRVDSTQLGHPYYMLQLADYDVDCITPFELKQNQPFSQGQRFSQIRFGSQFDLIIPLTQRWEFEALQPVGHHVEAGLDPLIAVRPSQRNAAE